MHMLLQFIKHLALATYVLHTKLRTNIIAVA